MIQKNKEITRCNNLFSFYMIEFFITSFTNKKGDPQVAFKNYKQLIMIYTVGLFL